LNRISQTVIKNKEEGKKEREGHKKTSYTNV